MSSRRGGMPWRVGFGCDLNLGQKIGAQHIWRDDLCVVRVGWRGRVGAWPAKDFAFVNEVHPLVSSPICERSRPPGPSGLIREHPWSNRMGPLKP